MANLDVNAPKARKSGLRSILGRLIALRDGWTANRKALARARAAHHASVLSAMTDDQLASWGIKRDEIIAHAYRNIKD